MASPDRSIEAAEPKEKLVGGAARRAHAADIRRILRTGTVTIKAGCQRAFDYPASHERQVPLTKRQIRNLNRTLDSL